MTFRRIASLAVVSLVVCSSVATAQASALTAIGARGAPEEGRSPKSVAANNEWIVGTQLGTRFIGEGDFKDNLLVGGLVRYEVPLNESRKWRLPIFSNLAEIAAKSIDGTDADTIKAATAALLSSAQGISVGLYPYRVTGNPNVDDMRFTVFLQAVAKLNTLKGRPSLTAPPTAEPVDHTMMSGRGAIGFEMALGKSSTESPGKKPLTMSLTFAGTGFNPKTYELVFGEKKTVVPSVEFSAILPVKDGAGVLFEGIGAKGHPGIWRVGMIIAAASKTSDDAGDNGGPGRSARNPDEDARTCIAELRARSDLGIPATETDEQVRARSQFAACLTRLRSP